MNIQEEAKKWYPDTQGIYEVHIQSARKMERDAYETGVLVERKRFADYCVFRNGAMPQEFKNIIRQGIDKPKVEVEKELYEAWLNLQK